MYRDPDYQFVSTDPGELEELMVSAFEEIAGYAAAPASPERLFIQWAAAVCLHERVLLNYVGNQNLPSRAEGENLDALGDLFFGTARPDATAAVCTVRFRISQAQSTAVLIPAGTRVTDAQSALVWRTGADVYVEAGDTWTDAAVTCQTAGTAGNGWLPGQISVLVDLFDYCSGCANITASEGGSDIPDDATYYALLREAMDGYATAGSLGGYLFHAKAVSSEIADVVANSPSPGEVRLYCVTMDGTPAGEELKGLILAACSADTVRPLTDHVEMGDPETVEYDIDLTYWLDRDSAPGAAEVQARVTAAVEEYIAWQSAVMGRDINPSRLIGLIMGQAGVKRVALRSPDFTQLRSGRLDPTETYDEEDTVPQIAAAGTVTVLSGGYEDG